MPARLEPQPTDEPLVSTRPFPRTLRYLREQLATAWSAGDHLPGELELAARLSVSRGTVRTALKELQEEGWIGASQGAARTVLAVPGDGNAATGDEATALLRRTVVFARASAAAEDSVSDRAATVERSIYDAFARRGHAVLSVDFGRADGAAIDELVAADPLGVVVPHVIAGSAGCRPKLDRLADGGVRVVVQGDGPALERFDRVISDHRAGIGLLCGLLRDRGVKRPVQVRSHGFDAAPPYWAATRYAGFLEETAGADARVVDDEPDTFDRGHHAPDRRAFERLTRRMCGLLTEHLQGPGRADALLFDTDFLCFYAAAAARRFGLEPNRDVLLVGYDDHWRVSPLRRFEPAVVDATVDKEEAAAGETMAELLLSTAGDGPRRVVRPPRLRLASGGD